VYLAFMGISYMGIHSKKIGNGTILKSSTLFFVLTNFGVWLMGYPLTFAGLVSCYTLAIPFFAYTIMGDLFFTHSLSYSFSKLEKRYPVLLS